MKPVRKYDIKADRSDLCASGTPPVGLRRSSRYNRVTVLCIRVHIGLRRAFTNCRHILFSLTCFSNRMAFKQHDRTLALSISQKHRYAWELQALVEYVSYGIELTGNQFKSGFLKCGNTYSSTHGNANDDEVC